MKDFPSCFGENGVQIADSSSSATNKATQNLVTCVYECQLQGIPRFIRVTWIKILMGQILTISIEDSTYQCLYKVDIKPWLFSKKKGFKTSEIDSKLIEIYWDLSCAKFGSGPEPQEGFYLAVICNQEMILLLGDLKREVYQKTGSESFEREANFVARKEDICGKKIYRTQSRLCNKGGIHNIVIECDTSGSSRDLCLVIRIDSKVVLVVRNLKWKFRGNHTILVEGFRIEFYWDVHSWLFGDNVVPGNGVFLFRCTDNFSVSSLTGSRKVTSYEPKGEGFSLLLYAWKIE